MVYEINTASPHEDDERENGLLLGLAHGKDDGFARNKDRNSGDATSALSYEHGLARRANLIQILGAEPSDAFWADLYWRGYSTGYLRGLGYAQNAVTGNGDRAESEAEVDNTRDTGYG